MGVTTTHYVLDPAAGLTQVLADGTNTYLYGNGRLAQYQAAMQYFGADGLGSVRQIYDASAQVIGSTRYDPYGSLMSQSGATSMFAFTGEQYDAATGLEYLRARYYSSAQGRFTTRDVWEGDDEQPQSLNLWTYVQGDPIDLADPSGLFPVQPLGDPLASAWILYQEAEYLKINERTVNGKKVYSPFKPGTELADPRLIADQNQYNPKIWYYVGSILYDENQVQISQWVKRQIGRESQFNPKKRGDKGEIGLMQVKPDTLTEVVSKKRLPQGDLNDPEYNLRAGIGYLSIVKEILAEQDKNYGWNIDTVERWKLIFAGYNAGYTGIKGERQKKAEERPAPTATRPKGLPPATPTNCPPQAVPPVLWDHIKDKVAASVTGYVDAIMGDWATSPGK